LWKCYFLAFTDLLPLRAAHALCRSGTLLRVVGEPASGIRKVVMQLRRSSAPRPNLEMHRRLKKNDIANVLRRNNEFLGFVSDILNYDENEN
jgi:hypothetical protein